MNEPIHWYKQGATTAISDVYEKDYIRDSVTAKQAIDESEYFGPTFSAITWEEAQQILAVSDDEDGYFNVVCCLMVTKIERISGGPQLQKGLDVVIKSTDQVISIKLNAKTPCEYLIFLKSGLDAYRRRYHACVGDRCPVSRSHRRRARRSAQDSSRRESRVPSRVLEEGPASTQMTSKRQTK